MGLLDVILGRTKPAQPDLDRLFGLPGARITLEASEGLVPSGQAGVCFKPAAGEEFAAAETEIAALLDLGDGDVPAGDATKVSLSGPADEFGYRWIVCSAPDFDTLVTRVHVVNSTLAGARVWPATALLGLRLRTSESRRAGRRRAVAAVSRLPLQARQLLSLRAPRRREARQRGRTPAEGRTGRGPDVEKDLDRWFPLWNLPVH